MQSTRLIASRICRVNYCRRFANKYLTVLPRCTTPVLNDVTCCQYSTAPEVIPPPDAAGDQKNYSSKIQNIVEEISNLSLLEVADLNELLKKSLNIQDAPMMAMGAMPATATKTEEDEEEAAPKREKTTFTVKLVQFDAAKKVQTIKEIKNLVEGLNLVQAKKFVESVPQIVRADIPKEEAEKLKEVLTGVGAEVVIE